MKEELKRQLEGLHKDPLYLSILESLGEEECGEVHFAEAYIHQESPFATFEPEN